MYLSNKTTENKINSTTLMLIYVLHVNSHKKMNLYSTYVLFEKIPYVAKYWQIVVNMPKFSLPKFSFECRVSQARHQC